MITPFFNLLTFIVFNRICLFVHVVWAFKIILIFCIKDNKKGYMYISFEYYMKMKLFIHIRRVDKMGYILPIENHGYNDYQKRVERNTTNPHHIEKPFKATLEIQHEDLGTHLEDEKWTVKKTYNPNVKYKDNQQHSVYSMLTGKGMVINESV